MIKVVQTVFNNYTNDSRVLKTANSLSSEGYKVSVVGHHDINLAKSEIVNGVKIHRVSFLNRKITKSKISKLIAYIKYIKEALFYSSETDIIHCNDLNTLPIGVLIKKFYNKNVKVVYDAHEYETQKNGLHGIDKKLVALLERYCIKYADQVITVSDSIAHEYVRLYGIDKPYVVLNTPLKKKMAKQNLFRDRFNISKKQSIFLYQGNFGPGRGIEVLLSTFKLIESSSVIIFMGYGQLENKIKEHASHYRNIYFHEAVNQTVLLDYTSSADFGIATIENTCLSYYYSLPNKIFEYIMANLAVIVSDLPEIRQVIEENQVGVIAKESNVKGLIQAIKQATQLNKTIYLKNIKKMQDIYNWNNQEKVLFTAYKNLEEEGNNG
jgi:glycosyltransferase involved in cell wall biosynthesis